eukprot:TRINITY_DN25730_c0_g1_i1.p1 TRINITY_DN25730_c0_g1~~TRINITY_DN25730_c0_g1_i1.p1  ORF type:complete len:152 (-),score=18.01 TRINITY_DN25730_c0_g1_i1:160-615(-)
MAKLVDKAKNFVIEKIARIEKPEADLTDLSVKDVSRDSVTFHAQLSVTNPYTHDIPISEISYTLKSANRVIASGTMADPGSITAKESTMIEIPVKVPYDILVSIAKDVGKDWDIDYAIDMGLTMKIPVVGNFTLPLSQKGETKLPTLSDVF